MLKLFLKSRKPTWLVVILFLFTIFPSSTFAAASATTYTLDNKTEDATIKTLQPKGYLSYAFKAVKASSASSLREYIIIGIIPPIKIQTFNNNISSTTSVIMPNFKLVNTEKWAINLSTIKIRYYFTNDGEINDEFLLTYSTVGSSNVTSNFFTIDNNNADRYLEIGFTDSAGMLASGASVYILGFIHKLDWSNFYQTNDYSFNATATRYTDATSVTGYISDILMWGTEP